MCSILYKLGLIYHIVNAAESVFRVLSSGQGEGEGENSRRKSEEISRLIRIIPRSSIRIREMES
ncbi:hypothetical protein EO95_18465 [Methanosarcina sp. 1.H.T.1A.1]|nr:hypothetical protein EO95_18465 [Methanosarcina sp. 1.H.T.1A.1]